MGLGSGWGGGKPRSLVPDGTETWVLVGELFLLCYWLSKHLALPFQESSFWRTWVTMWSPSPGDRCPFAHPSTYYEVSFPKFFSQMLQAKF